MKNLTWLITELTTLKNTYGECQVKLCQVELQPIKSRDGEDQLLEETDMIEKGKRYILEF